MPALLLRFAEPACNGRVILHSLQLDRGLPDYVVDTGVFDSGRRHAWVPGNRFRMYFGGKKAGPTKAGPAKRSGAPLGFFHFSRFAVETSNISLAFPPSWCGVEDYPTLL